MSVTVPIIERLSVDQVRALGNCGKYKQYCEMVTSYLEGRCVFCDPLGPLNKVVRENDLWRMWPNPFPFKNTNPHFVLAPKRHVEGTAQITRDDMAAMGDLFLWACTEYALPGGGLVMRFGSPEYHAGTVLHAHANLMVPDLKGEVRPPLSKDHGEFAEGIARIPIFEKLRSGTTFEELPHEEWMLVQGRV